MSGAGFQPIAKVGQLPDASVTSGKCNRLVSVALGVTQRPSFWPLLCVVFLTIALFGAALLVNRELIFDDAFITYRYAKNVASGNGLTFNARQAPVEGYTNLLLVLILTPVIQLGLDPLRVSQFLNVLSALLIGLAIFSYNGIRYHPARSVRLLSALIILNVANTAYVSMLGLETVLYTLLLFVAYVTFTKFRERFLGRYALAFGITSFLAFLLRPESALLVVASTLAVILMKREGEHKLIACACLLVSYLLPLVTYLIWKQSYFGTMIPNPFYVKVGSSAAVSPLGWGSVWNYFWSVDRLLVLAVFSFFLIRPQFLVHNGVAILFVFLYSVFFIHVDTLMDIGNRFLYPLTPFLIVLSLPSLNLIFGSLLKIRYLALRTAGPLLVLVLLLVSQSSVQDLYYALHWVSKWSDPEDLMHKEYNVAHRLAQFRDISSISIAFGDAGVIPYFTNAMFIDVVGLNDRYIAREKDLNKLVTYVFDREPTIIILPSLKDRTWITFGHGPLGDYTRWVNDERFSEYRYSGTVTTNLYDLQFLVRKDHKYARELERFLTVQVVDNLSGPFPSNAEQLRWEEP